jgi:glycosyltransferase involved in cell wall biosynthesis
LLFPIDWEEPFGLVMIEAMACATPVIAYKRGSVPEIITNGKNGFIVSGPMEGANAVKTISNLSRKECRAVFEERFTAATMADNYAQLYRKHLKVNGKAYNIKLMQS